MNAHNSSQAKRAWTMPTLTDVDGAKRIHSFVGGLTDASPTDPTTS